MLKLEPKIQFFEYLIISLLAILLCIFFAYFQPQIIVGKGYGWDGLEYLKIYKIFGGEGYSQVGFPFCNRIASAFLANLIGIADPHLAFKYINLIFSVCFTIFIYIIARLFGFNIYYSLFSFGLTVVPFFSPIRFTPFYPVYTDPPFLAILTLSFMLLILKRFGLSFILIVVLFLFREAAIFIAPFIFFSALYIGGYSKITTYKFIVAMAVILALKFAISKQMNCNGSQIFAALHWIKFRFSDPGSFLSYFASISMTAAPVIYISGYMEFTKIERISVIGLIISAFLAFVGGSDATRIFYSFFPLYFIIIISSIRKLGYVFSIFCIIGYLVTNRFSSRILEPLNYSPSRDESGYFWQFPDHARPEVSLVIISVWFILFFIYGKLSKLKN